MSAYRARLIITAAALLLLATGCASANVHMIPAVPGNRWEYEVVKLLRARVSYEGRTMATLKSPSSGSAVYEVVSVDSAANPPVYDYRETVETQSTDGASETSKMRISLTAENGNVKIISTEHQSTGDSQPDRQVYDPPLLYYLSAAAAAGESWEVGELRDGDTRSPTSARGAGRETVTVPAGTFTNCLKVVYSSDTATGTIKLWDKTFNVTSGHSRGIYWIADGVGVVKELEIAVSVAQADGPDGKPITVEAASCTVSELKPGYVAKN